MSVTLCLDNPKKGHAAIGKWSPLQISFLILLLGFLLGFCFVFIFFGFPVALWFFSLVSICHSPVLHFLVHPIGFYFLLYLILSMHT